MKKRKFTRFLLLGAVGLLMVSCKKAGGTAKWAANENSIYVKKDLQIQSAMVFTAAEANELYNEEELAAEAGEWIQDYNVSNGAEAAWENTQGKAKLPVALRLCSLEGQTGKLVFDYGSPSHFVGFAMETEDTTHTVTSLQTGTAASMMEAGGAGERYTGPDGSTVEPGELTKEGYQAIAVEGAALVCLEGKLVAASTGVKAVLDEHTVSTGEGMNYIIFQ
jgi:hypothetical protein